MPESIINNKTGENIKKYLGNKKGSGSSTESGDIFSGSGRRNGKKRKVVVMTFIIFVVAMAGAAYYSFIKGQSSFDEKKVIVFMKAQKEVSSGEEIGIEIRYENMNEVNLKNTVIRFIAPKEFVLVSSNPKPQMEKPVFIWDIPAIKKGQSGKIRLFGKFVGKINSEYKLSLELAYKPSNINYEYKSKDSGSVKISSIPLEFNVKSAESVNSGGEVRYDFHYKNISSRKFSNIMIKAKAPAGFEFKLIDPVAQDENGLYVWTISDADAGSEGNLVLSGILKGDKDEDKKLDASIAAMENGEMFEYAFSYASVKINEVPIVITQTVNGESIISAEKGSELEYKIKFKNISDGEIKGLIINDEIFGNTEPGSIDVSNGTFDGKSKITWSAFNVPKLASLGPGEEEEVSFRMKIGDIFPIGNANDKNFIIKNNVSIKSFNFTSGSSEIGKTIASNFNEVKIKSFPVIKQTAFYNDDHRIVNAGFIPPQVGEETTYTIHWNFSNLFNNTSNIRISTVLPENIRWTGNYIASDGKIFQGNENSGINISKSIDPLSIKEINGELLESRMGVSFSWNIIPPNELPQGFKAQDKLLVSYDDGIIKQNGDCMIILHPKTSDGYYCEVPWTVKLPSYKDRKNFKISRFSEAVADEDFYYDPVTREVVWELPRAEANTGAVSAARETVFQVGLIPRESDAGNSPLIIDKVTVSGYDDFTQTVVSNADSGIATDLPDDESIGVEEGLVVSPESDENI